MKLNDIIEVYDMNYDSKERGNNGKGNFLGKYKVLEIIYEDIYDEQWYGLNIETNKICLIIGSEVCGYGGGIRFEVENVEEHIEELRKIN